MVESKSTDKLQILSEMLSEAVRKQPDILTKVSEVRLHWKQCDGCVVPVVDIKFKD